MAGTGRDLRPAATLAAAAAALLLAGCGAGPPPEESPEPEAVQVGYGSQQRANLTGAVSSVTARDFANTRPARVEELLQGRAAGVQVLRRGDGRFSVRIRGAGGFMSDGEPLFVVDGVPIHTSRAGGALDGINPADVARIDVLKDAGSTAIYGVQGANGVILITTRRPD